MSPDNKIKEESRERRDELAQQYYGKPYKDLCGLKQDAIDSRIAIENRETLPLVEKARIFATQRHAGQVRPNKARQPFIIHPEEVATLVKNSCGSDKEIAAAWLHDVVEDTPTKLTKIGEEFGAAVEAIVCGLTDPPESKGLPLFIRKALQAQRVRSESASVKRVKLADQISNALSVAIDPPVEWDREKCIDYLRGAALIATECQGVSEYLDIKFQEAHHVAFQVYAH